MLICRKGVEFQSLSRDSTHVDLEALNDPGRETKCFNPSVGIRPMWTEKHLE